MYIYLDIVENFTCQMCGTCCRNDWMVTVDKDCYDRNSRLFETLGRQDELPLAFRLLEDQAGPGEYAYIAKKEYGDCWFLGADQLCSLHKAAGHSHLDSVCQTFPRYPMNTARGIELTLSFSCPAVLEMACRTKALTVVRSDTPPIQFDENSCVAEVFPRQKPGDSVLRYYFELEQHLIDIIQCRAMPLERRLHMLKETILLLNETNEDEVIPNKLDKAFRANYEMLDQVAESAATSDQGYPVTDILIENLLVNLIFKKVFYLYGLKRTMLLLEHIWQKVNTARTQMTGEDGLAQVKTAVRDIEFQYGHDRKSLLQYLAK